MSVSTTNIDSTKSTPIVVYTVCTKEEAISQLGNLIKEISDVTCLPIVICRILLQNYQWDQEALIEKYFGSEKKAFFEANNLDVEESVITTSTASSDCVLCNENTVLMGLNCGHMSCQKCWSTYFEFKFAESISIIPCFGCQKFLTDGNIRKLLNDPEAEKKFDEVIFQEFTNQLLKWCPGPDCEMLVKAVIPRAINIVCHCNLSFCFSCTQPWHQPTTCYMLRIWEKKCESEGGNSKWLLKNTKDCPKCFVPIEKNGGCNHMTCKSARCRYEFCWVCLGDWREHYGNTYACNRFVVKSADPNCLRGKTERFLHYMKRYANHQLSLKLEHKLFELVAKKMQLLENNNFSWIETQFLKQAVNVLNKARHNLMYSYVFGYFLISSNQSKIFDDNQSDLEMATEQLSGTLEGELETDDFKALQQKVQNQLHYVEKRRIVLTNHCTEGYENDIWEFERDTILDPIINTNEKETKWAKYTGFF